MKQTSKRDFHVPRALILAALSLLSFSLIASAGLTILSTPQSMGDNRGITWDAIVTASETNGKTDTATFGEATNSHGGMPPDPHDVAKPPSPIPPYLRVWLNDSLDIPYNQLWKDYRTSNEPSAVFNLSVQWVPADYVTPTTATITWNTNFLLSQYDSVLLYKTDNTFLVDMRTTDHYTFACPALTPQNFRIRCLVDTQPPHIVNGSPSSGYTGDPYTFSAIINDLTPPEQLVVTVNWAHGGSNGNDTMTYAGSNIFTKTVTLNNYTIADLTYHFYAKDNAKVPNSNYTPALHATITDDEPPVITSSSGAVNVGTGDPVTLWVKGTDNIGITSAKAVVDSVDNTMIWNVGMTRWEYTYNAPGGSTASHSYSLSVSDAALNTASSTTYTIAVSDNDDPTISDSTHDIATGTGNTETLWIKGTDNIGVTSATVTLDLVPYAMTWNAGPTRWEYTYTAPTGSTASHTYAMQLADAAGNTASTGAYTITVADDDAPVISTHSGNFTMGTGNTATLWVHATDNIGITTVSTTIDGTSHDMTWNAGLTRYEYAFTAPTINTLPHSYTISVSDATHTTTTCTLTMTVVDDDAPTITGHSSGVSVGTGETITLWLTATDNIEVSGATITLDSISYPMTWNSGAARYEYIYTASNSNIDSHSYTISAYDSVPNMITLGPYTIAVFDDESPVVSLITATPSPQIIGQPLTITASITDNVHVQAQYVRIDGPAGFTPENVSLLKDGGDSYYYITTYSITGAYNYTIWVKDSSNNQVTSSANTFQIYSELIVTNALEGWNYISLPFNQTTTNANLYVIYQGQRHPWSEAVSLGIVMDTLYDWNRTTQGYAVSSIMKAGRGYWMYAFHDCEIWATNLNPVISNTYITHLLIGWNAIGVPYNQPVTNTSLVVTWGGLDYTWSEATTGANGYGSPIVMRDLFGWNRLTQAYEITGTLNPGSSYWIYAYQNCDLKRI